MTGRRLLSTWLVALFTASLVSACRSEARSPSPDGGAQVLALRMCPGNDVAVCEAACRGGDAEQCLRAGNSYSTGQGARLDEMRAAELLSLACELGNAPACTFSGRTYEFGHGVNRDFAKANSLYALACERGDLGGGCYNEAIMLENGRGTARDLRRALSLYQRVCAAGSSLACASGARLRSDTTLLDGGTL